jgi:IS1 family transposase
MNRLTTERRATVIAALVEGNSLRGTSRLTDVARMTVEKLLRELGTACAAYHDAHVRGLKTQRVQCDEIWSFVGAKAKNVPESRRGQWGDIWTWTAIDANSKLIIGYRVGQRTAADAYDFMQDVASRLANRVQMTTDNLKVYLNAVDYAFGIDIDYAMLEKQYGSFARNGSAAHRYTPAKITGMKAATITGDPDRKHVSTSYIERQNLTMRMHMRRFARLTNAFSKKAENHAHMVALHFMYYNFCKIHQTLRVTPAMEAGLCDHVWSVNELVGLLDSSSELQRASQSA